MISTNEYMKNFPKKSVYVFALDAAKNAVPAQRPSIKPPPLPFAIYLNAGKKQSSAFKEDATPLDKE
jgi:hypothetical protein